MRRGMKVSRAAKRQFGFIYLRALRTGARALSLERGSLLDIILRLKDDDRSVMWEQTLASMEDLDPAIDAIPQLREILDEIDARVRRFVGLSTEDRAFRLYPSALRQKNDAIAVEIADVFDATWELEQTGIEYLLVPCRPCGRVGNSLHVPACRSPALVFG